MNGPDGSKTLLKPSNKQVEEGAEISRMGEVDRFSDDELEQRKIIYGGMPNAKILNTFRELRTQLLHKNKSNNFLCMVTALCHRGGSITCPMVGSRTAGSGGKGCDSRWRT